MTLSLRKRPLDSGVPRPRRENAQAVLAESAPAGRRLSINVVCPVCGVAMETLSEHVRVEHVNGCLDAAEPLTCAICQRHEKNLFYEFKYIIFKIFIHLNI